VTALGRLFRTTAFKLSLVYLVLTALVAAVLLGAVAVETTRILQAQTDQALETEVETLDAVYRESGIVGLVRAVERAANRPGSNLYLVTSPLGQPMTGNVAGIEPGALDREATREIAYAREDDAQARREAIARIVLLPGGFRLLVGRDLEERQRLNGVLQVAGLAGAVAVLVIGLGGGWLVASRVTRRIEQMTGSGRSIMAGDLARRLPVAGTGDEFDRLAESVNAMLARIEELMRGVKEVSDNIAHDLKTPLTRLRNRAEAALRAGDDPAELRAALGAVVDETDGLIRTFDALLMIARAESRSAAGSFAVVDLVEVASGVAELYGALAEDKGLKLEVDAPERLAVRGHRELLAQAVANLVDNAIKHTDGQGAPAEVRVVLRPTALGADIAVEDRGPGIPPEAHGRVTERFVRLEESRSRPGAGLGLALVAAIARLHGGALRFEDNAPGLRAVLSIGAPAAGEGA
jgi:signal transduction histidine kinase